MEPMFLEADFNRSGTVDVADFLILSRQFGESVDPPGTPPDISGNGVVDVVDFLTLSRQFGQSSGAVSVVPEPSAAGILGMGLLFLVHGRRRRSVAARV